MSNNRSKVVQKAVQVVTCWSVTQNEEKGAGETRCQVARRNSSKMRRGDDRV